MFKKAGFFYFSYIHKKKRSDQTFGEKFGSTPILAPKKVVPPIMSIRVLPMTKKLKNSIQEEEQQHLRELTGQSDGWKYYYIYFITYSILYISFFYNSMSTPKHFSSLIDSINLNQTSFIIDESSI